MSALVGKRGVPQRPGRCGKERRVGAGGPEKRGPHQPLEIEIDDLAISLLALQAPLAADLRLVTAAIKINNDLERMGDLSAGIAQSAMALIKEPMIRPLIIFRTFAGLAQSMVRKALDAFVNRDAEMARSVLAPTMPWTTCVRPAYHELISFMETNPSQIPQALYCCR